MPSENETFGMVLVEAACLECQSLPVRLVGYRILFSICHWDTFRGGGCNCMDKHAEHFLSQPERFRMMAVRAKEDINIGLI